MPANPSLSISFTRKSYSGCEIVFP
jgi:hypothetical protein